MAGFLAMLVIATVAASYDVQTVKARSTGASNFGQRDASPQAHGDQNSDNNPANGNGLNANSNNHDPSFGKGVSSCAGAGGC